MNRPAFSVALTGITRPVAQRAGSAVTPADLLAHHARVSSTNQDRPETGPKLLASCARREEWSVFEMVSVTFEIQTTRDIARQMLRHRSFSFQEFSQRYAVVTDRAPPREARMKNPDDRQKPLPCDNAVIEADWAAAQKYLGAVADSYYRWALNNGIAPEVARAVLPEGLTPSTLYMAGTVRSWIHYLRQRCAPETQQEHRLIAEEIRRQLIAELPEIASVILPVAKEGASETAEAWLERNFYPPSEHDFRTRLTDDTYSAGFVG